MAHLKYPGCRADAVRLEVGDAHSRGETSIGAVREAAHEGVVDEAVCDEAGPVDLIQANFLDAEPPQTGPAPSSRGSSVRHRQASVFSLVLKLTTTSCTHGVQSARCTGNVCHARRPSRRTDARTRTKWSMCLLFT